MIRTEQLLWKSIKNLWCAVGLWAVVSFLMAGTALVQAISLRDWPVVVFAGAVAVLSVVCGVGFAIRGWIASP